VSGDTHTALDHSRIGRIVDQGLGPASSSLCRRWGFRFIGQGPDHELVHVFGRDGLKDRAKRCSAVREHPDLQHRVSEVDRAIRLPVGNFNAQLPEGPLNSLGHRNSLYFV